MENILFIACLANLHIFKKIFASNFFTILNIFLKQIVITIGNLPSARFMLACVAKSLSTNSWCALSVYEDVNEK